MIALAIVTLLILDSIWLTINKGSYSKLVKDIQKSQLQMNFGGVIVAYIVMIIGLVFIIIPAAQKDKSKSLLLKSLKYGALFGFVTYAIFNATNYAIFKNYSIYVAVKDTLWGTVVYCIATYVALM